MITDLEISSVQFIKFVNKAGARKSFDLNLEDVVVKKNQIKVYFVFSTIYNSVNENKVVGRYQMRGKITAEESTNTAVEIDKKWNQNRSLPAAFAEQISDLGYFECTTRGILLSYAIGMSPPLPHTKVAIQRSD